MDLFWRIFSALSVPSIWSWGVLLAAITITKLTGPAWATGVVVVLLVAEGAKALGYAAGSIGRVEEIRKARRLARIEERQLAKIRRLRGERLNPPIDGNPPYYTEPHNTNAEDHDNES